LNFSKGQKEQVLAGMPAVPAVNSDATGIINGGQLPESSSLQTDELIYSVEQVTSSSSIAESAAGSSGKNGKNQLTGKSSYIMMVQIPYLKYTIDVVTVFLALGLLS
jgi:hypothetical protein